MSREAATKWFREHEHELYDGGYATAHIAIEAHIAGQQAERMGPAALHRDMVVIDNELGLQSDIAHLTGELRAAERKLDAVRKYVAQEPNLFLAKVVMEMLKDD